MSLLRYFAALWSRWLDGAASAALSIGGALQRKRKFRLAEQDGDAFLLQALRNGAPPQTLAPPLRLVDGRFVESGEVLSRLAGAQVEIALAPRRFMFPAVDVPQKASGFLDAIVRAQIDRLTPWSAAQAVFGCGAPAPMSGGRIGVTVAATARSSIAPFIAAAEALKPASVVVSATLEGAGEPAPIVVHTQQANRQRRLRRARRILVAALALGGAAAAASVAIWIVVSGDVESSRLEIAQRMAERRAGASASRGGADAAAALLQRKREATSSVVVLDALSRTLPDDTYLTELKVADASLEIDGVTREAASLIAILEQAGPFKNATFSAPTTRARGENAEQFHIEAQIAPALPVTR